MHALWQLEHQLHEGGVPGLHAQVQESQGDGEMETLGSGAAGIDVNYSVLLGLYRLVGMAADHEINLSRVRAQIQVAQVVQNVECRPACLNHRGKRQFQGPWLGIDIASYGEDRSNRFELIEHFGRAYVAGMNDQLHTAEGLFGFPAQQAMSV